MKWCALCFLSLFVAAELNAQARMPAKQSQAAAQPKLVVGIVIDQMRWDYLYRYRSRYSAGGFNRLIGQGFSCENTFISYTPTYTAAGHTGIYTGSVPALHGIIGNNWYERKSGKVAYCTDDSTVNSVGSSSIAGKMSPRNMWATTVCDELRLSTNFRSKVIGIALKDRGAILPAGHSANAAYWFDNATGGWISSSYYMKELPSWVEKFNAKKFPDQSLANTWNTMYPINSYVQSTADNKPYEGNLPGEDNTFPHATAAITKDKYQSFRYTPFGNTYTFDMAKAAVEGEQLGTGSVTDFLALSFSSTDYIGHTFGPNSIEVEDTYLRFDKDLADFLNYLDGKMGKNNYLLFLSADHAAAHVPGFLKENHVPAGFLDDAEVKVFVEKALKSEFGLDNVIQQVINYQLYLDRDKIRSAGKNMDEVAQFIITELLSHDEIAAACRLDKGESISFPDKLRTMVINGYNQKRSGDIQFMFKPDYFDGGSTGTTHGTWSQYDSHIPLLWFGWNIKPGKTNRETYMADIAPTITALLQIQMPDACIGKVIEEITKGK